MLVSAINETLAILGMPTLSDEQAYNSTSMTPDQTFKYLFGDRAVEAKEKFYGILRNYPMDELQPLDGVTEFLSHCKNSGYTMGVVSNKNGPMLRQEVNHLQFDGYFSVVIGAGDSSDAKPNPAPAIAALDQLGRQAGHDVWFIGDNLVDWQCANAAGCQAVRIWPNPKHLEMVPEGTVSVDNFTNLRDIMEKL